MLYSIAVGLVSTSSRTKKQATLVLTKGELLLLSGQDDRWDIKRLVELEKVAKMVVSKPAMQVLFQVEQQYDIFIEIASANRMQEIQDETLRIAAAGGYPLSVKTSSTDLRELAHIKVSSRIAPAHWSRRPIRYAANN